MTAAAPTTIGDETMTTDQPAPAANPPEPFAFAQASPDPMSAAAHAAIGLMERLETLLDGETGGLRGFSVAELKDLNRRKSQCLLELTRASRALEGETPRPELAARVVGLRAALDRNQATLGVHIAAVREIATIIADAIRAHESDGTYADTPQMRAAAPALRSDAR